MDLAAIAIDGNKTTVILRRAGGAGHYDEGGKWVPAASSDTSISAAIQPATGSALEDLPEGIRTEARSLLWTREALQDGDLIIHSGRTYRILYLWDRIREGGFCKAALGLRA